MDVTQPLALLGNLSPQKFMKTHWQKKPLLVRQAIADFKPLLSRSMLLDMAARDEVHSRLVVKDEHAVGGWRVRQGPFVRRSLPALKRPGWTLLLQGMDVHDNAVHQLMNQFRFVPDARLDDLMISLASDQGGVGPHFDSYDVFLLQAHGHRRWRIGRQKDLSLQPDVPLKILSNFEPEQEFVMEPGDMLYLPPRYAHDGVAVGECMTYSIGFRSPGRSELASEMLQRLAQEAGDEASSPLYRDPGQLAQSQPAQIPAALLSFAKDSLTEVLHDQALLAKCLGEHLTEPKANVWFEALPAHSKTADSGHAGCRLDRRTRMMYDDQHVFINGESYRISGRDARIVRRLADERMLLRRDISSLSAEAADQLQEWAHAGWIRWERP